MFIPEVIVILILIGISFWISLAIDVFDYFMYVIFIMMFIIAFIGLFIKNIVVALFFSILGTIFIVVFVAYKKLKDH